MKDWRNLLLLGVALLVGAGLFEVAIRTLPVKYDLSPNWRYHPVLGWSQIPNGSYDVVVNGRPVRVSFNSLGFRDREHERVKPPGVKRIVVIGDSFSEAVQVNLQEMFQQQLEQLLNARGSDRWEVINLGVGDFGTAQAYIALREYGLGYDPDVVIQQVFPLNDICNNSIGLYGLCRSNNDLYRPYFIDDHGELRQVFADPIRTFLRRKVVSYHVLEYWLLRLFGPDPQNPDDPSRPARLHARGYDELDPLLYTFVEPPNQPAAVVEGWRITERLIERTVALARERGFAYVGLVIPFELRLGPGWDKFAAMMPPPPMHRLYPEERLGALYRRLGVESIMAIEAYQPYLDEVLPYVGGHLSVAGHQRTAEALFRLLVDSGIAGPDGSKAGAVATAVRARVAAERVPDVGLPYKVEVGKPAARQWLSEGWYAGEGSGRGKYAWSGGERAVVAIPLPADHDVRMAFEALPFEFEGSPIQEVTVVLDGKEIARVPLRSGWHRYGVTLPAAGLGAPIDTVEFRFTLSRAPKDVPGTSPDGRSLAVAWRFIEFSTMAP